MTTVVSRLCNGIALPQIETAQHERQDLILQYYMYRLYYTGNLGSQSLTENIILCNYVLLLTQ